MLLSLTSLPLENWSQWHVDSVWTISFIPILSLSDPQQAHILLVQLMQLVPFLLTPLFIFSVTQRDLSKP